MKDYKDNTYSWQCGFSLVELLVAMAMALVAMAAVFKVYVTHQDSYLLQDQVAEMQQNARTARYVMTREIRMAGYDPTRLAGAGFVSAHNDTMRFTMDIIGEDGTITVPGDDITYSVSTDNELLRDEGSGKLGVAENIEAVGFAYAFDADDDGGIDTSGGGNIIWAIDSDQTDGVDELDKSLDTNDDGVISSDDSPAGLDLAVPVPVDRIRAVRLWLLARTSREDKTHSDSSEYVLANRRVNPNDGHRRYLVTTTIKCRNMAF